jgi:sulfate adenylyltransferase subunit 2
MRPVVERNGIKIMVDDERMPIGPRRGEAGAGALPHPRLLPADRRHRIQCHHLPEIIEEMLLTTSSERQGRLIDHDQAGSMEQKKRQGYF